MIKNYSIIEAKHMRSVGEENASADDIQKPERTRLSLSISKDNKKRLMAYASSRGMTAAGVINEWISSGFDGKEEK